MNNQITQTTILEKLISIENLLLRQKTVLIAQEAADYIGVSLSTLYKMTSAGIIPRSRPNGKRIYFSKTDLDQWLLSNRSLSKEEKQIQVATYIITNQQGKGRRLTEENVQAIAKRANQQNRRRKEPGFKLIKLHGQFDGKQDNSQQNLLNATSTAMVVPVKNGAEM